MPELAAMEPFDARAWVAREVGCHRVELRLIKEVRRGLAASSTSAYRYLRGGAVCALVCDTVVEQGPVGAEAHRVLALELRGQPRTAVADIELPVEQPVRY